MQVPMVALAGVALAAALLVTGCDGGEGPGELAVEADATDALIPPTDVPTQQATGTPSAASSDGTEIMRYAPPELGSVEASGECFAGSLTSGRPDALRCGRLGAIYDPCFSTRSDVVVCPNDPRDEADDVAFHDRGQPILQPAGEATAWFVVLETGEACSRLSNPGQLPTTSFGETVYQCSPGDTLCSEASAGSPFWTAGCYDASVSSPIQSVRLTQVWE